jgi:hypothetical protein
VTITAVASASQYQYSGLAPQRFTSYPKMTISGANLPPTPPVQWCRMTMMSSARIASARVAMAR